jgi:hypothetical protein
LPAEALAKAGQLTAAKRLTNDTAAIKKSPEGQNLPGFLF